MSTLNVSNISDGTTTVGTSYVVNGSAKAWVNFNGTGTIATRDSFNVASLTDNGTGNYTVNFSNAFGTGDYSFLVSCKQNATSTGPFISTETFSTTSANIRTRNVNQTDVDCEIVSASNLGDLA